MRGKTPAQAPNEGGGAHDAQGLLLRRVGQGCGYVPQDEANQLRLESTFMPSKLSDLANSIVVKVTGLSSESTSFNFFKWSRVMMLNSPVDEAKMSI